MSFVMQPDFGPVFFHFIYLSLDLFFGARSGLYIMVAALGQLMWSSCCQGPSPSVDTEVHIKGADKRFKGRKENHYSY